MANVSHWSWNIQTHKVLSVYSFTDLSNYVSSNFDDKTLNTAVPNEDELYETSMC